MCPSRLPDIQAYTWGVEWDATAPTDSSKMGVRDLYSQKVKSQKTPNQPRGLDFTPPF